MEDLYERYHGLGPDLGAGLGKPTRRSASGGIHAWHWGVGLAAGRWCREAPRAGLGDPLGASALARRLVAAAGPIRWAGIKGLRFGPAGAVETPWGAGKWGTLQADPNMLFLDFMGQQHLVNETRWPELLSIRCGDLEKVVIKVEGG